MEQVWEVLLGEWFLPFDGSLEAFYRSGTEKDYFFGALPEVHTLYPRAKRSSEILQKAIRTIMLTDPECGDYHARLTEFNNQQPQTKKRRRSK